jgi:hypothetical protein
MQPRVRLSLAGGLLLLTGVLLMSNSVWTLPLVVVGALMIVIAWVGHRLEGRFAIEWGEGGTELAFRATIKPAQPANESPMREQIIDGEAHTVEIDVGELKTLIAAVESAQADGRPAAASAPDIRIRRVAGGRRPPESVL